MIYSFIKNNKEEYGLNYLLKIFGINKNAYYNFIKHRKAKYENTKIKVLTDIVNIYHEHQGTVGYRMMCEYLKRKGHKISALTTHKYMNKQLKLKSIARREKQKYVKSKAHKVFENKLDRKFSAEKKNQKWCTDFTYLLLADGSMRYNCSIMDIFDRSIVASITSDAITAELAKRTLEKAIKSQKPDTSKLLLHSDQGSQYTSKEFTEYCKSYGITQSMSKAGCPYDNAPMERYFNTLKCECINQHVYKTEQQLYEAVENFAYVYYNHKRPHLYNDYKTPYKKRCGI